MAAAKKTKKKATKPVAAKAYKRGLRRRFRRKGFEWSDEMNEHYDRVSSARSVLRVLLEAGINDMETIEKSISAYWYEEKLRRPKKEVPGPGARYRRGFSPAQEDRLFEEALDSSLWFLVHEMRGMSGATSVQIDAAAKEAWNKAYQFAHYLESNRPIDPKEAAPKKLKLRKLP